ncbi:MAG: type II toxin-antitoxin system VapC family toxin [bacterium]
MSSAILADAGPLVAILNRTDTAHEDCVRILRRTTSALSTTWPVVTEATYLLGFSFDAQDGVLEMIERAELRVLPLEANDVPALRVLMRKYRDLPMDLADASLVHVAGREGIDRIFTLDRRDFGIYRLRRGRRFTIVP